MASGRPSGGEGRERAVLGIALSTSLVLALVAFSSFGDPELAARAALERLADTLVDGVRTEWQRLGAGPDAAGRVGRLYEWQPESESSAHAAPAVEARYSPPGGAREFAIKLMAADAREVYDGDVEGALLQVSEALALEGLAREQQALGLLRGIQLAGKQGDAEAVAAWWELARTEVDGGLAQGGVSLVLLSGLAAEGALDEAARCELATALSEAWGEGRLALPDETATLIEGALPAVEEPAQLEALARRLEGLAPSECLAAGFGKRRAALLADGLRRLTGALPEPFADGRWRYEATRAGAFAVRRRTDGACEGGFVDTQALALSLRERVADAGLLPGGFSLEFTEEAAGERVAGPVPLLAGELGFGLFHADPGSLGRAERRRVLWTRAALLVTALFSLGAGLATWRALRRGRRLSELKSTFVANVSHELRTPLASILLLAENLEEGRVEGAAAQHRYHTTIRREARRLRRLVNDVLDFSRLERGAPLRLELTEVALAPWLAELEGELHERAQQAGTELVATAEALPERACFDAEAVRRALWNLVDNALKYGAGPVELALRGTEDALSLRVADHGPGIPAAERERVFGPFTRLGDGEGPAGTGLGLAIVRAIAHAHGGMIRVTSREDGAGSVFELTLPLAPPLSPKRLP